MGSGLTVTIEVAEDVHVPVVPVIVYVVVTVGLAVTDAPVVALNPVEGDQLYVVAPLAVSVVLLPLQIVAEFTVTTGFGFTVTLQVLVPTHEPVVPVTVYTVVTVGLAVTLAPVVALNPVAGDQLYVVAPLAVRVVELPRQIVCEATVTAGGGETVTVVVTGALVQVPVPTTL